LNTYAQESVGVDTLKELLLQANSKRSKRHEFEKLFSVVGDSAQWLHIFHTITKSTESGRFDYQEFMTCQGYDVDFSSLQRFKFKNEVLYQVEQCLDQVKVLDGRAIPLAGFHFDFTPAHIFLDHGIHVIDIIGTENIPIYEDVGRFMTSLVTVNGFPMHPFFDYGRARKVLVDQFLRSYHVRTQYDVNEFYLFANCYFLKHLCVWLEAQYQRVSSRSNSCFGRMFTNLRLLRIFEPAIVQALENINSRLKKLK
jgi:hypothetical protein